MKIILSKITMNEFRERIYENYRELFPANERRSLKTISETWHSGHELIYVIKLEKKDIGFFLLEKIDGYPYYLDYFAIFEKYQNKGYGSIVLKNIIDRICHEEGLLAEIEEVNEENEQTIKRSKFYQKVGFEVLDTIYELDKHLYNPVVCTSKKYTKKEIDKMFFKYYELNVGKELVGKYCKIIK